MTLANFARRLSRWFVVLPYQLLWVPISTTSTSSSCCLFFFFFQAEDGIRDLTVTGVQTCALPILSPRPVPSPGGLVVKNGSKIFSRIAVGIPQPESITSISTPSSLRRVVTLTFQIGRASCRERV